MSSQPLFPGSFLARLSEPIADALCLPALPFHIDQIALVVAFYQLAYSIGNRWISRSLVPGVYSKLKGNDKLDWDVSCLSLLQSLVNSSLAVYLLVRDNRESLNWEERVWGYHENTASGLALATGYFVWHLCQTTYHRERYGMFMVFHAIAVMILCGLGFRPFCLCYAPVFLQIEIPNIFLNFQRFMDKLGYRESSLRALNRKILLLAYFLSRIVVGFYFTALMYKDVLRAITVSQPKIPAKFVVGSSSNPLSSGDNLLDVPAVSLWMAVVQLGAITLIDYQTLHWFWRLIVLQKDSMQAKDNDLAKKH